MASGEPNRRGDRAQGSADRKGLSEYVGNSYATGLDERSVVPEKGPVTLRKMTSVSPHRILIPLNEELRLFREQSTTWNFPVPNTSEEEETGEMGQAVIDDGFIEFRENYTRLTPKSNNRAQETTNTPTQQMGDQNDEDEVQLPQTVGEYQAIMKELQEENFSLKLRIFFLEGQFAKMKPGYYDATAQENIELKMQLEELYGQIEEFKQAIHKAQQTIHEARATREKAMADLKGCLDEKKLLEEKTNQIPKLESELAQTKSVVEQQRGEISQLQNLISEADDVLREKLESESKLEREKGELEKVIERLQSTQGIQQKDKSDLQEKLQNTEARLSEMQRSSQMQIAQIEEAYKKLSEDKSQLMKQYGLCTKENQRLKSELQIMTTANLATSTQEDLMKKEIDEVQRMIEFKNDALSRLESRISSLTSRIAELEDENAALSKGFHESQGQLKRLHSKISAGSTEKQLALERENEQLRKQLESKNSFNDHLKSELDSERSMHNQDMTKVGILEREIKSLKSENEALQKNLQDVQVRLEMERSKSTGLEQKLTDTSDQGIERQTIRQKVEEIQGLQQENLRLKSLLDSKIQSTEARNRASLLEHLQKENDSLKKTIAALESDLTSTKHKLIETRGLLDSEMKSKAILAQSAGNGIHDPNQLLAASQRTHQLLLEAILNQLCTIFPEETDGQENGALDGGKSVSQRIKSKLRRIQDETVRKEMTEMALEKEWAGRFEKMKRTAQQLKTQCESNLYEQERLQNELASLKHQLAESEAARLYYESNYGKPSNSGAGLDPRIDESVREVMRLLRGAKMDLIQGREDTEVWQSLQFRLGQISEANTLLKLEIEDRKLQEEFLRKKLVLLKEEYQRVVVQMHEMAKQLRIPLDFLSVGRADEILGSVIYPPSQYHH